jgi:parvulin-like peptidyl-prolyl isomerase
MVRLNLISVPYGADSTTKVKAKELADQLSRDIGKDPTKFDAAALKGQTRDSGYVSQPGVYVGRTPEAEQTTGEMFLNIAFNLKQGEVSALIENEIAYQFIKVTEIYPQKILDLDDIIDPANPVTVRNYIRQGLMNEQAQQALTQAFQELVDELRKGRNAVTVYEQYLNW